VILDTDMGDDIDDAFALALALRSPELRLLGVTTAYGDTELRARLVDRFLAALSRREIPVASGAATAHENIFSQAAYARQAPQRRHAEAVVFLLSQIHMHPGQITLIALGPLFNIQAAIERDPNTFRQLKRVVLMGGSLKRGYDDEKTGAHRPPDAEWNFARDPAGARALLASGVPVYMMPLDATQIHLDAPSRGAIFSLGSPLTDQLTLLYHQWSGPGEARSPVLYDPLAVAYAFRPELCPATPMRLDVDEKGFMRTVVGPPNAQLCLQADEKRFLELLQERIAGEGAR
jgi:inosine-uridine nucleoside N-ribohydrolase